MPENLPVPVRRSSPDCAQHSLHLRGETARYSQSTRASPAASTAPLNAPLGSPVQRTPAILEVPAKLSRNPLVHPAPQCTIDTLSWWMGGSAGARVWLPRAWVVSRIPLPFGQLHALICLPGGVGFPSAVGEIDCRGDGARPPPPGEFSGVGTYQKAVGAGAAGLPGRSSWTCAAGEAPRLPRRYPHKSRSRVGPGHTRA